MEEQYSDEEEIQKGMDKLYPKQEHWGYNKSEIDERMEALITTIESIVTPYNTPKSNTNYMRKKFL